MVSKQEGHRDHFPVAVKQVSTSTKFKCAFSYIS